MKYSAPATTSRMAGISIAPLQIGGDSPVELRPEHHPPQWSVEETDACFIVRDCPASFLLFKVYDTKLTRGREVGRSQKWHGGRRVALRISRSVFSALSGTRLLGFIIVAPQRTTMARNPLLRNHLILSDKC
jgi:hypothetical protein